MVSGSLSLPSRGSFHRSLTVLFSIGRPEVFRLGWWSTLLPAGFLVPRGTPVPAQYCLPSPTGVSPSSPRLPRRFGWHAFPFRRPSTPHARKHAVWALPRSLAATWGISLDSFSSGYLDVSVRRVASLSGDGTLLPSGCPIRVRMDPCLPAAPHAFSQLAAPFLVPERQGIRHMPFLA